MTSAGQAEVRSVDDAAGRHQPDARDEVVDVGRALAK
jgi:hypothetical protein